MSKDWESQRLSYAQNKEAIDLLLELPIRDDLSNPFLLAVTLQILPFLIIKLSDEYKQNPDHQQKKQPEYSELILLLKDKEFQFEILSAYACVMAKRESVRLARQPSRQADRPRPVTHLTPEEILDFQVITASQMAKVEHWNFSYPLQGEDQSRFGDLFNKQSSSQIDSLLQACFIRRKIDSRLQFSFRHLNFAAYLAGLTAPTKEGGIRFDGVIAMLEKNIYHLDEIIR